MKRFQPLNLFFDEERKPHCCITVQLQLVDSLFAHARHSVRGEQVMQLKTEGMCA
jgi:hypothetical protein